MSTPRPPRLLALAAATTALGLALAGCSGGGGGGGTAADEWEPGPLDEYLAQIYGYSFDDERSEEEMQAESAQQNRRVEEVVAACMQEQGFDYTPVENTSSVQVSGDDLDVEWGSREFAEQYGYGISTDPWGNGDAEPETTEVVDPNQEYRQAMSESEGQAYDEALWGPPVEDTGEEGTETEYEYDWTTAGCYGEAQHEVYDQGATGTGGDLEDEVTRFWETVQQDSRMTELNASWLSCMADEGYDGLTDVNTSTDALYDEYNALQGWDDPEYQATMESWDWEAQPDGPPAPEADPAKLKAFTEKEIGQAVADHSCQEKIDYIKKASAINTELQQEFVDQHRAELEAWVEAATADRSE